MSLPFDFYVNDLGFNKRISVDTPEERATAQFRKDQFDSQSTVGDQSLTGWWTRGQLSFHKGAGIRYYEVLEGDTVLNRFADCENLDVFEPGEVTLLPEMSSFGVSTIDAVPTSLASGGGVYALTDTGVVHAGEGGTNAIATSDAGVPTGIASDGEGYYVTNGTKLERQFAPADVRTNHITNPSLETGTGGWAAYPNSGGGARSIATSTNFSKFGSQSLRVRSNNSLVAAGASTTITGLSIGQDYFVSAWIYFDLSGSGYQITCTIDGTTPVGTADYSSAPGWRYVSTTFSATATSHSLVFVAGGSLAFTNNFYVDSCMWVEDPFVGPYFDGSQPGCSWVGTPHASKSTWATADLGASSVLWTLTGANWVSVWWAKGRLFAVDDEGYWYSLSTDGGTTSNADAFWNSGRADASWSLTDSPGAVYICDGHDVFAITIDTDGLLPTLGTPTTVAQVPLGETVSTIRHYLGYVAVVTSSGVRMALVQSDNTLALGALTIEGDFTASRQVAVYDTLFYVAGRPKDRGGDTVVCAIDVGTSVGNNTLVFAWAPQFTLSETASTVSGVLASAGGDIYAWSSGDMLVSQRDTLAASGYLTTGYIRFGTLDTKHFASVLVRLSGTAGSVEVSRVDADGTITSLGTLAATDSVTEIPLGLTSPVERIALRFDLSRSEDDDTEGPTLLGYQLKALPVPKRQRLIRVPLMLFDREVDGRTRTKRGAPGQAWTRLAALEALEESNAVVTYTDSETGETGSGYIEAVEVKRTAPTSRQDDGFGGLLYLTLRKL